MSHNNILFFRMIRVFIILFAITSVGFTSHRHVCTVMEDIPCDMACAEYPAHGEKPPVKNSTSTLSPQDCHIDTFIGGTAVQEALTGKVFKSDHQFIINPLLTLHNEPVWSAKAPDFIHTGVIKKILIIPSLELFPLNEAYLL
jgi:hypothetical protein